MPLTLSHPAAVLPLRRLGLPFTAMVVGSMVPDLPVFAGWWRGYEVTHSLVGVATVDAVLALVVVVCWLGFVRDAMVDLLPAAVRSRLAPHVSLTSREWWSVVPAAWVGGLTHVAWDAFTHPGRWGVRRIEWLQTVHAGLPGHKWVQYASGVVGLAVVCVAIVRHLRSLPARPRATPRPARADGVLLGAALVVVTSAVVAAALHVSSGLHAVAFTSVVTAIVTTMVVVAAVAATWKVSRILR